MKSVHIVPIKLHFKHQIYLRVGRSQHATKTILPPVSLSMSSFSYFHCFCHFSKFKMNIFEGCIQTYGFLHLAQYWAFATIRLGINTSVR